MALPGAGEAVLIDPIEGASMSMEPLYDLFRHEGDRQGLPRRPAGP
jgi:ribonuclease D